ncbi:MAG: hypothetical protein ABIV21_00480 [Pyrinomonadaceae bacterium]
MIGPEDIHHSVADAGDMEEVWDERIEVTGVISNLLSHPGQIISRWNWKTAMLGAVVRASFYLAVYQASRETWLVTLTAVLVELTFRFITTGMAGAVVQSFRRATPVWLANVIVSISLPAFSHTIEFATHYAQERYLYDIFAASENNVARQRTFAISVLFSVISALFNLFAMKHGVLLVGAGKETQSFFSDIKRIPLMVAEFVAFLPVLITKFLEDGRVLNALITFVGFGIAVGTILGTVRGKWRWAWTTAAGAWGCLFFSVLVTVIVRRTMRHHGKSYTKRY